MYPVCGGCGQQPLVRVGVRGPERQDHRGAEDGLRGAGGTGNGDAGGSGRAGAAAHPHGIFVVTGRFDRTVPLSRTPWSPPGTVYRSARHITAQR